MTNDDRDVIYLVTCVFLREEGTIKRSRTWGWARTHAEAEEWVLNNVTDMYEMGYYNCAVIEAMQWGPIAVATGEWWYRVEYVEAPATYFVSKIEKPEPLNLTVSFGMG